MLMNKPCLTVQLKLYKDCWTLAEVSNQNLHEKGGFKPPFVLEP
jgi:hypothetical protein